MEENKEKKYYVDFYDMVDGWGTFGFFTDRLFDEIPDAIKLCDSLNSELDKQNKECGEHYGVMNKDLGREIYCGMDENYKAKIANAQKSIFDRLMNGAPIEKM